MLLYRTVLIHVQSKSPLVILQCTVAMEKVMWPQNERARSGWTLTSTQTSVLFVRPVDKEVDIKPSSPPLGN